MKLTILGNNSALPAYGRYPTAQVLEMHDRLFMVDCGEGAQMRMQQFEVRGMRIQHIFISHIHGDHCYGLPGLVSSMALLGREKELWIYCPAEIKKMLELQIPWDTGFPVHYRILEEGERAVLIEHEKFEVSCFPVYHSVPTHGFRFAEKKRKRILLPEQVKKYEIPAYYYGRLCDGSDYETKDGQLIKNEWVTQAGLPDKVYVYAADTRYAPEICDDLAGADLLYHESTYLNEQQQKAIDRFHSTAREAALIAQQAGVKKLLLGHFSSKYKHLQPFVDEAQIVFPNTELALEGNVYKL